jgi:hypothetical protein
MSESLVSIIISFAILLMMFVFVPCLEFTVRGCKKIDRSLSPAGKRRDDPTTESLGVAAELAERANKKASSTNSNAA